MDFRDIVENSRPTVVSEAEKLQQKNQKICDFVIEGVRDSILEQARKCLKEEGPLNIRGKIYLGTSSDGMFDAAVDEESTTTEVKHFFSFLYTLSEKSYRTTVFKVSQNGERLLEMMRTAAEKDNICINGYLIGFGSGAETDSEETHSYVGGVLGVRVTNLFGVHTHTFPVKMKSGGGYSGGYDLLSPETNGLFKSYLDRGWPGLYVEYTYKG